MEEEQYSLRCSIFGHSMDVRAVKPLDVPYGGIVTGSRDRTVKVWTPDPHGNEFSETHCLIGPTHFIASLCTLPASTQFPAGLILAGCNDSAIYGFSLNSSQPVLKLLGHSSTVCSLVAGNFGTVVSGSWDKTARIWQGQKCVMVLEGHQEAVWAVEMIREEGLTLTASADKSVRLWRAGVCEKVFNGHDDCVRGLAIVSNVEFLSCSNDLTVRMWQTNGTCLGVFCDHTDYIYSIDLLSDKSGFVTTSEDQTLKIWKTGVCVQTIKLPAKSLWAVSCMKNGDIAVAGSDGSVRVFTKRKELKASPERILEFDKEVQKASVPKKKDILGDLKLSDLPGTEVLVAPGLKDGQTTLCKDGDSVCVYQWSAALNKWSKYGDVLEAKDGKKKTMYEGKEYDFVFVIDVDEGKFLKLPYNIGEDPWIVAQDFIDNNNLSPLFLDQIATFIVAHSDEGSRGTDISPGVSDPFTGVSRYIPGQGSSFVDKPVEERPKNIFFPLASFIRFDTANIEGLESKLVEFNDRVPHNLQLDMPEIEMLLLLANFPTVITDQQMAALDKVMSWPDEFVFPALDLFRLAVRSEVMKEKVSEAGGLVIINYLIKYLDPAGYLPNSMLALRTFCNFFGHASGSQLLLDNMEKICLATANCVPSPNKNVQIAVATLFLNYAVALQKSVNSNISLVSDAVVALLEQLTEPEAVFRMLVCIGTLMENSSVSSLSKYAKIKNFLQMLVVSAWPSKVQECSKLLLEKLP